MSYTHFTLNERKSLQELYKQGKSIREIARSLDRAPSSISRELKRNCNKDGSYHHWRATSLYIMRRRQGTPRRTLKEGSYEWNYIIEKLNLFWSPEQIVEKYRKEHNTKLSCVSTIYRYIYRGEFPTISAKRNLRRRGKRRQTRKACYNTIQPERTIPQWTKEIKQRLRLGDFEGDTVYGTVGKSLIVTMVDRKTRYLIAAKLPNKKAEITEDVIVEMLKDISLKSISLDNGSEFANFKNIEKRLGVPIYFAEPHKPWQRGTNENTNDILRFFFPKGTNFDCVTDEELQRVVYWINARPRKCLNWLTPFEAFWRVALR